MGFSPFYKLSKGMRVKCGTFRCLNFYEGEDSCLINYLGYSIEGKYDRNVRGL